MSNDSNSLAKNLALRSRPVDEILEVENFEPVKVLSAAFELGCHHVLQNNHILDPLEQRATRHMIVNPSEIFVRPWGLWAPKAVDTDENLKQRKITYLTNKNEVMDDFRNYLSQYSKTRHVRSDVLLILDELYVNVIKAATFKKGNLGYLFVSLHENFLVVGSLDVLGRLQPGQMLENALRCYRQGVAKSIRQETRGAGIGSFLMFESSNVMTLAVRPESRTVVALVMVLDRRVDEQGTLVKNIHWYIDERKEEDGV